MWRVVVVVARRLANMVVWVSSHGGACHGAELVRVVVGMHGCQVGATLHPAEVGARRRGRVALAVRRRRLAVGDRI